jgi:hypothetical protein
MDQSKPAINIYLNFSDFDPSFDPNDLTPLATVKIKTLIDSENRETAESVGGAAKACQGAIVGSTVTMILVNGALSQVWALLHGMQIFLHFPMIQNFP